MSSADDPLRMLLGDLATQRATRRIGLPPLSDDAVRALVGQRDVDAAELCRVTGGNPFLVCEAIEAGGRRYRRRCATWWAPGWPVRTLLVRETMQAAARHRNQY